MKSCWLWYAYQKYWLAYVRVLCATLLLSIHNWILPTNKGPVPKITECPISLTDPGFNTDLSNETEEHAQCIQQSSAEHLPAPAFDYPALYLVEQTFCASRHVTPRHNRGAFPVPPSSSPYFIRRKLTGVSRLHSKCIRCLSGFTPVPTYHGCKVFKIFCSLFLLMFRCHFSVKCCIVYLGALLLFTSFLCVYSSGRSVEGSRPMRNFV